MNFPAAYLVPRRSLFSFANVFSKYFHSVREVNKTKRLNPLKELRTTWFPDPREDNGNVCLFMRKVLKSKTKHVCCKQNEIFLSSWKLLKLLRTWKISGFTAETFEIRFFRENKSTTFFIYIRRLWSQNKLTHKKKLFLELLSSKLCFRNERRISLVDD